MEQTKIKKRTINLLSTPVIRDENIISLMSYTFIHNNAFITEKINALVLLIKNKAPDVICINALNSDVFNYLNTRLSSIYDNVQVYETESIDYGTCILTKRSKIIIDKTEDNPYYFDLDNSKMDRKILGLEATINGKLINIIGVHFEHAAENDNIRLGQFEILQRIIKELKIKNYIILGNCEITDSVDADLERKIETSGIKDMWIKSGCSSKIRNTYLDNRMERILYKVSKKNNDLLEPVSFSLIGLNTLPEGCKISTHNGIFSCISIK